MTTYAYDGMNQLINETRTEPGGGSQSYAYAYDDFGNRQSLTATGQDAYTVSYDYDLNNRLLEDIKTETGQVTRTTYYYDPNGNQVAKAVDIFSSAAGEPLVTVSDVLDYGELSLYNGFNQLVRTRVNGVEAAYDYAPSGLRLSKTVEGITTSFVLDGGYVVLELQNGAVTGSYVRALNLVAEISGDEAVYYLYNGHGDVVHLTGSTGAVTRSYEYDAFGNELDPDDQDANPFRYCAEYFDTETGRIYLRARYYDPAIGRFTAEDTHWNVVNIIYGDDPTQINGENSDDPLGLNVFTYIVDTNAVRQSGNRYVYCLNNAIMYVDATGEIAILTAIAIGALVGAIIGGAVGGKISYDKYNQVKWQYVVGGALLGGAAGALIGWGAGAVIAKLGVVATAKGITAGTSGAGFATFNKLKDFLGSAGTGYQWHHIVERCQSQISRSGFSTYWINNTNNVIRVSDEVHVQISRYYSSIHDFTQGMTFRNWLNGQSFEVQYQWGIKVLRMFGVDV